MRRRRRLAIFLGIVLALTVIFVGGVKVYLSSSSGRAAIQEKLQGLYGGPLELDAVDVGFRGTTIQGLRLFEVGPDAASVPWLTVADVQTDVTLGEVIRGSAAPQRMEISGAAVVLRFDASGRLLTRLPAGQNSGKAWPTLQLENAQVTLRQEGRPDFTLQGIRAAVQPEGGRLVLDGQAADSIWGDWTLHAVLDPQESAHALTLLSPAVSFDGALLKLLPFVPGAVWQQVEVAGITAAEIEVKYDPAVSQVHYRADLKPAGVSGRIAVLELAVEQLRGQIVVENHIVRLRDITCQTAGGELAGDGELDFWNAVNRLQFKVAAQRLDLQRLPASWGLPAKLDGRLSGQADLQLSVQEGRVQTSGTGQATVHEAKIGGVPAEPIRLRLGPAGQRFRFDPEKAVPQGREEFAPAAVLGMCCLLADPEPLVVEVDVVVRDADLAELLRGLDVAVPVAITGRGTAELRVVIPVNGAREPKTYRVAGRLHSPLCRVAKLELRQLEARIDYADGVLQVHECRAELPASDGVVGSFSSTARLELIPSGRLTADFQIRDASQPVLQSLLAGAGIPVTGLVSGGGKVSVPIDRLRDLAAWQAAGDLSSPRLEYSLWAVTEVRADLRLAEGVVSVPRFSAKLEEATLRGEAQLPLDAAKAGRAVVRFAELDAGWLARQTGSATLAVAGKLTGSAELTIPPVKPGAAREPVLEVVAAAPRLQVEGIPTERLQGSFTWRGGQVDYRAQGDVLGGRLHLDGQWPGEGRLRLERVLLSRWHQRIAEALRADRIRGRVDLDLTFRREGEPATTTGTGRLSLSRLRWGDVEIAETVTGDLVLTSEQLQMPNLAGNVAGGLLFGQLNWDLKRPERRRIRLRLQQADSARLLAPWPALAAGTDGPVDVRYSGSLGKEWRGSADVYLARGTVLGLEATEWRVPVRLTFAPAAGRGQLEVPDTQVSVAQGRAQGQVSLTWGEDRRLDAKVSFFGVKLRSLLRPMPELSTLAAGDLSGRLELAGSNFRTMDDLTGSLDLTMKQGQVFDLPFFRQLARYIAPGQAASAFQDGALRARLNRGVVKVEYLRLKGPFLQAQLTGTVTLQGRLDMEATANPGLPGADQATIRVLGLRLPAVGAIPSALVNQASGLLLRRLVHLDIGGTVRNPSIQIMPLRNLSGDTLRFFLSLPGR